MQKKWLKWVDFIEKVTLNFAAFLMLLMAILVSYQVFARYVIKDSPFWVEEISINFMMWIGLLGAAGGTWTDTHMDLNMIVQRFPKTLQLWLRVLSDLLIAVFAGYLVYDGTILVQQLMGGTLSTLPVQVGYTYLVLPIAGVLMVCFALIKAANRLISHYVFKEEFVAKEVASH